MNQLSNKYSLWYHHDKENWKISGFKKIYEINNIKDFWSFYNNLDKIGGITFKHYFLMKDDIPPIWEDEVNKQGGCFSYKINDDDAEKLWTELSVYLVCDELTNDPLDIVGLSICSKKNNSTIIKIWNKNSKNNSLSLINKNIIKKWGTDIIYIAHIPNH